jgi:uncharacterized protein
MSHYENILLPGVDVLQEKPMARFAIFMKMNPWSIVPGVVAVGVALVLLYGAYVSLTSTQVVKISTGPAGGGYYEIGQKLEQVLSTDLGEQRLEAPVVFQRLESDGAQENLEHLASRRSQLGLALEGLSVKPKVPGAADIRGLVKLSQSVLHIIVGQQVSRTVGKRFPHFSDLLEDLRPKLGHPLRVYVGSEHSATHTVLDLVLEYYKASKATRRLWEFVEHGSYAEAATKLAQGHIDVVCLLVAIGSPAMVTMSQHGDLVPLTDAVVDAIHTLRPALSPAAIPAGVYNKDFPRTAVLTLGADDILLANGEVSNRLAYRIVRTIAIHWQELQSGMLLPEDFAKAQLPENKYYPLHPGAVVYYKGEEVPLWPWFENKVRVAIEHRDIVLSVVGGIPTIYALLYAWYQRRRVNRLMSQIAWMKTRGTIDRATIEGIRMHALTLLAQGKLSRDSYASLNEYIEAYLKQATRETEVESSSPPLRSRPGPAPPEHRDAPGGDTP